MMLNRKYQSLILSRRRYFSLLIPLCGICSLIGFHHSCSAAVNPTVSLSVSNPNLSATVAPGETAYLSSNVTYSASDIESYTIQVSYADGFDSLKLDGGTITLAGAGSKTPANMSNNTWGFSWTDNTTNTEAVNSGLTYYTVPTYGTNGTNLATGKVENVTLPTTANNTLATTTRRIVFAAKFAENNNNSGHYKTKVQLSMVATPRKTAGLEDATYMQDLNGHPEFCTDTPFMTDKNYSVVYTLTDKRDASKYTVRKFADGNNGTCWMTQNLKLKPGVINQANSNNSTLLTKNDTDITSDSGFTLMAGNQFPTSNNYLNEAVEKTGSSAGTTIYYSWTAATAEAGTNSITSGSVDTSICPKGWTLPTGGTTANSDFYKLFKYAGLNNSSSLKTSSSTSWGSGDLKTIQSSYDSNSKIIYDFKYTGYVRGGSLTSGTAGGFWWSSTVTSASGAYYLYLDSSSVYPGTNYSGRYDGCAIRCIARNS